MLVRQARLGPVGHVHVRQPGPQPGGHLQGVGAGYGGVRQVEGRVLAVDLHRVPVRGVRSHLGTPRAERVQVLHRELHVGFRAHAGQPGLELADVLPLPAERRM